MRQQHRRRTDHAAARWLRARRPFPTEGNCTPLQPHAVLPRAHQLSSPTHVGHQRPVRAQHTHKPAWPDARRATWATDSAEQRATNTIAAESLVSPQRIGGCCHTLTHTHRLHDCEPGCVAAVAPLLTDCSSALQGPPAMAAHPQTSSLVFVLKQRTVARSSSGRLAVKARPRTLQV